MIAQRDLVLAVRNRVDALVKQGKSQQEIVDAHLTAELDAAVGKPATGGDRFVSQVYAELTDPK